ncbi:glycosyltransferase [Sphingobium scionense]|nr:glycosyltransferase [Sphingobium scionense]
MSLETTIHAVPEKDHAMVMACFSFRYDHHLVPGLLDNIRPMVHGWVSFDDRSAGAWYSSEPQRRRALLNAARQHGAEWILVVDPDERFEDGLATRMPFLTGASDMPVWRVDLFEMFAPDEYRVDGIWGGRSRSRLFPVTDDIHVPDQQLHADPFAYRRPRRARSSNIACYHLRMIAPERRQLRRDQYALLDPERKMQDIGYDYLAIEAGAQFASIAAERQYSPAYVEDGGLWAPPLPAASATVEDPLHCRLRLIQRSRGRKAPASAADIAARAATAFAADGDVALLSGALALEAGQTEAAEQGLTALMERMPAMAAGAILLGRARLAQGDIEGAKAAADHAVALAPSSRAVRKLAADARRYVEADIGDQDALWRRWVKGGAHVRKGALVPSDAAMTVVVMGFRAQPDLAEAVASIVEQAPLTEIIVVNSGGGEVAPMLAPWLDQLHLIELEEPHYVGAARNIGIDASRAPIVAFLAGDCLAAPGWVVERLKAHDGGALAVPSAIVPAYVDNLVSWVSSAALRSTRWPGDAPMQAPGYGMSYARSLFDQLGYFPVGVGGGEDSYLNRAIGDRIGVDLSTRVVTAHRDPVTPLQMARDAWKRGYWRVQWAPEWRKHPDAAKRRNIEAGWGKALRRARNALGSVLGSDFLNDLRVHRLLAINARARQRGMQQGVGRMSAAARLGEVADGLIASDPQAAMPIAQEALRLDPCHAGHHLRLAQLHYDLRQWREAARIAELGAAIAPHEKLVALLCASLWQLGEQAHAADMAEEAALAAPVNWTMWMIAADYALKLNQPERALVCAHFAFVAAPASRKVGELLMKVYRRLGLLPQARTRKEGIEHLQ